MRAVDFKPGFTWKFNSLSDRLKLLNTIPLIHVICVAHKLTPEARGSEDPQQPHLLADHLVPCGQCIHRADPGRNGKYFIKYHGYG